MAFNYGPYTFDAQADGDASAFSWTDQVGTTNTLQAANTSGRWCHDTNSTTSSNVGPDGGQGGNPDGFAYTEMSSQSVGDIWYVEFDTDLDASTNAIVFDFYWCARGDGSSPLIQVQSNENGAGWVDRGTATGSADTVIPGTSGATEWNLKSVDLTGLVSGTATRVRVMITMNGATSWHHDVGFDTVSITGTDLITVPTITDIEDEQLNNYETGIVVDGTTFESSKGSGKLEITPTSSYANAVEQTTTNWSDTQITFSLDRGSVDIGTAYVWITNDNGDRSASHTININALVPTVTSVSDGDILIDETGVVIEGSNFFSTPGLDSRVEFCQTSSYSSPVEQLVSNWGASSITIDVDNDTLSTGTIYAFVTNSDGGRNTTGFALTLSSPPTPIILDIGNETLVVGQGQVDIDGLDFGATQGTGKVEICPSDTYGSATAQVVTDWTDTKITFTVVQGELSLGANYVFVTSNSGLRNATGYYVALQAGATSEGLYKESSFQATITSTGVTVTAFLINDEG